jgi:hypothetical protein
LGESIKRLEKGQAIFEIHRHGKWRGLAMKVSKIKAVGSLRGNSPAAEPPQEPVLSLPRFSSMWRLLIYPVCIVAPGAGFAMGFLYARQEERSAKNFGRICLALAVLGGLLRLGGAGQFSGTPGAEALSRSFY